MTVVSPQLKKLQEEGEMGRQKINQWTRYLTVALAAIQTSFVAHWLQVNGVGAPGWGFRLSTVLTLTTGTMFVMWLGEQITERGVRSEERRVGKEGRSRGVAGDERER